MPRDITITLQDGSQHVYKNAPDDVTPDAVSARASKEFGQPVTHLDGGKSSSMSLGDVATGAVTNAPASAADLVKNIYQALRHPIDTAGTALDIGAGELQKITPDPIRRVLDSIDPNRKAAQSAEAKATAVNDFYKDRYGSVEGFKKAVATDPVGVLADASVLAGGASGLAKAGGLTKAAALADKLGTVSNPISLAAKGIGGAANLAGKGISEALGVTTGAGPLSIRTAYQAGKKGGSAADALVAHMRGQAPMEEIVTDAKGALGKLREDRGAEYRAGMGTVNSDPTTLSLDPVDQALSKTNSINNFEGIDLSSETAAVRKKLSDALLEWQTNPSDKFRTAAGLDALKKRIGIIRDTTDFGSPDRVVANEAYNAVKDTIVKQAPEYGKTMQDYAKASDQIDDIQKTLSLGNKAATDTSVRKLQSALRDNVNTSFGRRTDLANVLADRGATNLLEKIAGQTLSSPHARGLGYALSGGEVASVPGLLMSGHPAVAAGVIPALAMQSPRLVGEASFAAGKGARLAKLLKEKLIRNPKIAAEAAIIADELGATQVYAGQH